MFSFINTIFKVIDPINFVMCFQLFVEYMADLLIQRLEKIEFNERKWTYYWNNCQLVNNNIIFINF